MGCLITGVIVLNIISHYNNEVTGHFHCTDMRNDIIADLNVKELKLK